MKVAYWAIGILVLSMFGLVLVNVFGNITVTNQLNYTAMKNTVEAAMYDAIDLAHYRSGFCLCPSTPGQTAFTDKSQYHIEYLNDSKCNDGCKLLEGEYKITSSVFAESLVRRFSELVNNKKNYRIIIQDIVEYPPKVSVKVESDDEHAFSDGDFTIVNSIDGILEEK